MSMSVRLGLARATPQRGLLCRHDKFVTHLNVMCIYGTLLQIETLQYKICSYPFCTKEVTSNALWHHNMSFLIPKISREVYNVLVGIGHHGPERKSTSLLASVYFHKANTVDFSHLTMCAFV